MLNSTVLSLYVYSQILFALSLSGYQWAILPTSSISNVSKSVIVALLIAVLLVISVAMVASRYNWVLLGLQIKAISPPIALIISTVVTGSISIFDVVGAFLGFIYLQEVLIKLCRQIIDQPGFVPGLTNFNWGFELAA